jgi:hypothetical protein
VHVYGSPKRELADACSSRGLALHVVPWTADAERRGLSRDAAYLVRPDGYVALADPDCSRAHLGRYLDGRGLRFAPIYRASSAGTAV